MNEVFVSVYIYAGMISEVKAFKKVEDAHKYFDAVLRNTAGVAGDCLEDYICDPKEGLFHFLDIDGGRHPVELSIEKVTIIQ